MSGDTGVLDLLRDVLRFLLALPVEATDFARRVDDLQFMEVAVLWLLGLAIFGFTGWCLVRFRRRAPLERPVHTERVVAPRWLELSAAGVLLAVFVGWWVWGFAQFAGERTVHDDAYEVYVTGKQWMWKFDYPEGNTTAGVLYVPAGRNVRLLLTSRDVIHSFFVPDFRLKQDAVPGRYLSIGFRATSPGTHDVFCAEFCGLSHSRMWAKVVVLAPDDFDRWARTGRAPAQGGPVGETPVSSTQAPPPGRSTSNAPLAERGRAVAARLGCSGCHSENGDELVAPTWLGIWGTREPLLGGDTATVNAAYVTESMMDPAAKIVEGFEPVMPSFQGAATPADVAAIIEYMRSLSDGRPGGGGEP